MNIEDVRQFYMDFFNQFVISNLYNNKEIRQNVMKLKNMWVNNVYFEDLFDMKKYHSVITGNVIKNDKLRDLWNKYLMSNCELRVMWVDKSLS